jgi:hypothetical protein
MEFARLALVYTHLIACCIALGAILTSDIAMLARIFQGRDDEPDTHMQFLKSAVSIALVVLWGTGLFFVWQDSTSSGFAHTLANPKLQGKIIVVTLLTLNGLVLHYSVLPMLSKAGSILKLNPGQRLWAIWSGALSGVSWMYAAFLGIARPLAWKCPLQHLLLAYPFLLAAAFAGVSCLTYWALRRIPRGAQLDGGSGALFAFIDPAR